MVHAVLGTEEALGVGWGADTALEVVGGDVELWRGTSVSTWPRGIIQRALHNPACGLGAFKKHRCPGAFHVLISLKCLGDLDTDDFKSLPGPYKPTIKRQIPNQTMGERSGQTFFQRRYTNGQGIYEEKSKIISH